MKNTRENTSRFTLKFNTTYLLAKYYCAVIAHSSDNTSRYKATLLSVLKDLNCDIVERTVLLIIIKLKWQWASHIAPRTYYRCAINILE